MPVQELEQEPTAEGVVDQSPLFDGIESIKGCKCPDRVDGLTYAIAEAVLGHQCLGE